MPALKFPDNKKFAFTIVDDTDQATVENVSPVYEFLIAHGLRTTKTVWPLSPTEPVQIGGATLADPAYRDFVLRLRDRGFEMAFHGATSHSSTRRRTAEGLERFREIIGYYPRVHINHFLNRENLYWGGARLSTAMCRLIYRLATITRSRRFEGHNPRSPYFWGDLCRQHIQYVRNFTFREVNLLNVNPTLPYRDPGRPYVNYWFSSTEAAEVKSFCAAMGEAHQDRLESEGGVCIIYAHLAAGFLENGKVAPEFGRLIKRLAARNGWFVPLGELLDYLRTRGAGGDIPPRERATMERRWVREKIRYGSS